MVARIVSIHSTGFLFLRLADDPTNIYSHLTDLDFKIETAQLGDVVDVTHIVDSAKGRHAKGVRFVRRDEPIEGRITRVCWERGFAFAALDGQRDVFLHSQQFSDCVNKKSATFDGLVEGDLVRFVLVPGVKGPKGVGTVKV